MTRFPRALVLLLAILPGCHAALPDPASLDARPADFVLAAAVYTPPASPQALRALPRALRPARYIVEADARLRAAVGPGSDRETYPPPTRQLTTAQMDRLWLLVRDSGLLEPGNPYLSTPHDPEDVPGPTAQFYIAYKGGRAHILIPLDRADAESSAAEALLDELAALSWITD